MTVVARSTSHAVNVRSGIALAAEAVSTRGRWERLRGLLGRPPLEAGQALVIAPCNGIHTVGMRYPIDVVFIDRGGQVLRTAEGLRPGRCIPWVRGASTVIELPVGAVSASQTLAGDLIEFAQSSSR